MRQFTLSLTEFKRFQRLLDELEETGHFSLANELRWAFQTSDWRRLKSLEAKARSMLDHKAASAG